MPAPESRCTEYGTYPVHPSDVIVNEALTDPGSWARVQAERRKHAQEMYEVVKSLADEDYEWSAADHTAMEQLRLVLENELDAYDQAIEIQGRF